ncbi:MAG: PSD1 and planctomycete cytochrome C domain-containing protein [Pirellulaceae bacterium]
MVQHRAGVLAAILISLTLASSGVSAEPIVNREQAEFFEKKIRPIFVSHCLRCHGSEKQENGLRLDSAAAVSQGGESGPVVVPGDVAGSLLISAVRHEELEMPPSGRLAKHQVAALVSWVKQGAVWPSSVGVLQNGRTITDDDRSYWAFQPLSVTQPPNVEGDHWSQTPIDHYVVGRLKHAGLTPAPRTDRRTLIRRAYLDLWGIPPSSEEVQRFLVDNSEDAFKKIVDHLLADPRYGEHWGRHWLDLVRYAESDGYKQDAYRPNAWRYRDYVIDSINNDKPYPQFVREQLAGDEIETVSATTIAATGFYRLGIYEYNQRDVRTQWESIVNEITDLTSEVFLGVGLGCARCHDHKFDPLLQVDYYRFRSFFAGLLPRDDQPMLHGDKRRDYQQQLALWQAATQDTSAALRELEAPVRQRLANAAIEKFPKDIRPMLRRDDAERSPYEVQIVALASRQLDVERAKAKFPDGLPDDNAKKRWQQFHDEISKHADLRPPSPPTLMSVSDVGLIPAKTFIPGQTDRGELTPAKFAVLGNAAIESTPQPRKANPSSGRRLALANWIADPNNPLSTRVITNRIWQFHFGEGLVRTSSDFGRLGEPPSHPLLLDWLTRQFVENGWRFKPLHRAIMLSATYQQSSQHPNSSQAAQIDPDNRFRWRWTPRRLTAEQYRDSLLAVTGELEHKRGGPSVASNQPRRSVYVKVVRNLREPLLAAFDAPDGFTSVPQRDVTTTPLQALLTLNGQYLLDRSRTIAETVQAETSGGDLRSQIDRLFQRILQRSATPNEFRRSLEFVETHRSWIDQAEQMGGLKFFEFPRRVDQSANQAPPIEVVQFSDADPSTQLYAPTKLRVGNDFKVDMTFVLSELYPDAKVRTLVSQWNNNHQHSGWSIGITSRKSAHEPRNLIVQLVGGDDQSKIVYEVITSDLRPKLNTPYRTTVRIRQRKDSPVIIEFMLQESDGEVESKTVLAKRVQTVVPGDGLPVVVGGRHKQTDHRWAGLLARVELSSAAGGERTAAGTLRSIAGWTLTSAALGRREGRFPLEYKARQPEDSAKKALVDLAHVLLNTSEFLYLD